MMLSVSQTVDRPLTTNYKGVHAMATAKAVRTTPILTNWGEAVDSVNYAKGTDVEVVKATKTNVPNKGATPLFKYKNAKGNIGDWYAVTDITVVEAPKAGAVTVTQKGFTDKQLAKIKALVEAGVL
jgi:hypothetical protein